MTSPPPGYPEPSASGPPPGYPNPSYPQPGYQQPGYAPPGYAPPGAPQSGQPQSGQSQSGQPHPGQPQSGQPPFGQAPFGQRPPDGSSTAAGPARSRPAVPPLPVLAVLVVCALALLNAIFGFLSSASLTSSRNVTTPLGSVYAVAGWIPALFVLSGLAAAATRLKGVSVPTLWAASAAAAVTGGVGALFYLVAREGVDAGLGYVLRSSDSSVGSSASAGLVLIVLFGLLQLVAALGGLLLTQSPQLATRRPRSAKPGPDAAHRYGPGPGSGYGRPEPQGGPWGPPAGYPNQPPHQPGPPAGPPSGPQPQAPGHDVGPGGPANERPYPSYQDGSPYGPQGGYPAGGQPQPPGARPYGPAGGQGLFGGSGTAYPVSPGIAPYRDYDRTGPSAPGADAAGTDGRPAPAGWTGSPPASPHRGPEPSFYDPQTGARVPSGLTGAPPLPSPPAPIPAPVPTDGPPLPAPAAPVEYQRTEYGSPDFEWEPTYSEAPTYEARAEEEEAEEDARREAVVRYEASDQRPQYEPPRLDSARHEGWDAGFAEDTLTGSDQPPSDQDGPRYRSIPRAE